MKPTPEQIKNEIAALKELRRVAPRKDKGGILADGFIFQLEIQIHVFENGLTEAQAFEHYLDGLSFGSARDACRWLTGEEPTPPSTICAFLFSVPA